MIMKKKDLTKAIFHINETFTNLPTNISAKIECNWQSEIAANHTLFNGVAFTCVTFSNVNNKLVFEIAKTNYKRNLWAKKTKSTIPGLIPICTGVIFITKDNVYQFVRRSQLVGTFKNCISYVAGILDYSQNYKNFIEYTKENTIKEIQEETILKNKLDPNDLELIGAAYQKYNSQLFFTYICKNEIEKLIGEENTEIINVKYENLSEFFLDNRHTSFNNIMETVKLIQETRIS